MPPNKDAPGCLDSPPSLICLPPISEDLQLVWTQAALTSDLDGNPHLLRSFSYFPYPNFSDLALLCLRHGLPMEKVKAWFMAQRLRCGISWSAEEIEETRTRLIYRQDRLHFSCLLAASAGDACHQSYKDPEYHQLVPTPLYLPIKCEENQQCVVTSSSHCVEAQEMREPPRTSEDMREETGNGLSHPNETQENGQSALHRNTKETPSTTATNHRSTTTTNHRSTTTTSRESRSQNSHTTPQSITKTSSQPSPVNGSHPPAIPQASSIKATPSSTTTTSAESRNHQNSQSPACDQQQVSGCLSDTSRRPRRKTKEQLDMLKSFFIRCQWARREDYHFLEQVTGLPRSEIIQWFGDTRYAVKHGNVRWFRDNAGQSSDPALSLPPCTSHVGRPDTRPLERYWAAYQQVQERDLPMLCLESGMEAEQVLKWFHSHSSMPCEVEVCLEDEEEEEVAAAALLKEEDEDYEIEEEDDDNDEDWTM